MKTASAATLAILASGQFLRANLYKFVIVNGSTYYFTDSDAPLTVGGQTYLTGLTIQRGTFTQKAGTQVDSVELVIAPQPDNPAGAITISGVPFLQAARLGVFDNALVLISKLFLSSWSDTTPGAVPWYQGYANNVVPGRMAARFTIDSEVTKLQLPMPRNVYQTGCLHALFDAGCTLVKASFTSTGSTSGTPTAISFNTSLTQATGYFDLGIITFTSGANNGVSRVVKSYNNTGGAITLVYPFPSAPAASDTFSITPGCDKTQSTCTTKFSNILHFRGYPYIPNPETIYDGGAASQPAPTSGEQTDVTAGSAWSSKAGNSYVP